MGTINHRNIIGGTHSLANNHMFILLSFFFPFLFIRIQFSLDRKNTESYAGTLHCTPWLCSIVLRTRKAHIRVRRVVYVLSLLHYSICRKAYTATAATTTTTTADTLTSHIGTCSSTHLFFSCLLAARTHSAIERNPLACLYLGSAVHVSCVPSV